MSEDSTNTPAQGAGQAPPPAAVAVVTGGKTEREALLEKTVKDRETRIAELEDERRRLLAPPPPPPPPLAVVKKSWLAGATFFENED